MVLTLPLQTSAETSAVSLLCLSDKIGPSPVVPASQKPPAPFSMLYSRIALRASSFIPSPSTTGVGLAGKKPL